MCMPGDATGLIQWTVVPQVLQKYFSAPGYSGNLSKVVVEPSIEIMSSSKYMAAKSAIDPVALWQSSQWHAQHTCGSPFTVTLTSPHAQEALRFMSVSKAYTDSWAASLRSRR